MLAVTKHLVDVLSPVLVSPRTWRLVELGRQHKTMLKRLTGNGATSTYGARVQLALCDENSLVEIAHTMR